MEGGVHRKQPRIEPYPYRAVITKRYVGVRPRSGWLGTGIAKKKQEREPREPLDPMVKTLLIFAGVTFCFILCVPAIIVLKLFVQWAF